MIGLIQFDKGERRYAEKTFLEMVKIAQKGGLEEALVWSFGNIARLYRALGKNEKALEYSEKSLGLAQKLGDLKNQTIAFNIIGSVYYQLGKTRKALGYYQKSLKLAEKLGDMQIRLSPSVASGMSIKP
jgi:tetratricopeptide (TPR) repeat protein